MIDHGIPGDDPKHSLYLESRQKGSGDAHPLLACLLVYLSSETGSTTRVNPSISRTRTRVPLAICCPARASHSSPWIRTVPQGSRSVFATPTELTIPASPVTALRLCAAMTYRSRTTMITPSGTATPSAVER